jgi:hypothetical protein
MKETVLIVHGTFSAPSPGNPRWYEPDSAFCRELDEQLAKRGSAARCWAHLDECGQELLTLAGRKTAYFSWSGNNSWYDRLIAAKQLKAELSFLHAHGWQWHIVAHSHGGNVALEVFNLDNARGELSGNAVLLGTPILSYSLEKGSFGRELRSYFTPFIGSDEPPVPGKEPGFLHVTLGVAISLAIWALISLTDGVPAHELPGALLVGSKIFWLVACTLIVLAGFGFWYIRFKATIWVEVLTGMQQFAIETGVVIFAPRTLFISTDKDEAYCFLANVIKTANPWANRPFTKVAISSWFQAVRQRAGELDAIHYPWAGMRSAFWLTAIIAASMVLLRLFFEPGEELPWILRLLVTCLLLLGASLLLVMPGKTLATLAAPSRFAEAVLLLVGAVSEWIAMRYARRSAWKTLQALALGLSGSPYRLRDVSVAQRPDPKFGRGAFLYEPLAKSAEDMALAERIRFGHDVWHRAMQSPNADFWQIERWPEAIGMMASDANLVHTVYYRHPDVIYQIARHLARNRDELLKERTSRMEAETPLL